MSEAAMAMPADEIFLTPAELSERWKVSRAVLSNWRAIGKGPEYVQLGPKGGSIVYRLSEILQYERRNTVKCAPPKTAGED